MPEHYSGPLVFLESLAGYVICILVAVIGLVVAWKIATGQIDISNILMEKDGSPGSVGSASMARFQLLIFIFVIALSFFIVVISNIKIIQSKPGDRRSELPDVPNGVLAMLGISASSYAVGKAIQHGAGMGVDESAKKPE
jgi:hypothetical protein